MAWFFWHSDIYIASLILFSPLTLYKDLSTLSHQLSELHHHTSLTRSIHYAYHTLSFRIPPQPTQPLIIAISLSLTIHMSIVSSLLFCYTHAPLVTLISYPPFTIFQRYLISAVTTYSPLLVIKTSQETKYINMKLRVRNVLKLMRELYVVT